MERHGSADAYNNQKRRKWKGLPCAPERYLKSVAADPKLSKMIAVSSHVPNAVPCRYCQDMPFKRESQTKNFHLVLCKYNKAETDTNNDFEALKEYDKVHNTSDASKNPKREALSLKIYKSSTRYQVIKNRFVRCGPWEDFSEEDINRACLAEDLEKTRQEAFSGL